MRTGFVEDRRVDFGGVSGGRMDALPCAARRSRLGMLTATECGQRAAADGAPVQ